MLNIAAIKIEHYHFSLKVCTKKFEKSKPVICPALACVAHVPTRHPCYYYLSSEASKAAAIGLDVSCVKPNVINAMVMMILSIY